MKKIFSFGRKKKQPPSLPSPGAYELHKKDLGKLHRAAASGDLSQMRRELKKDDIDGRDKEDRTPLHLSCASGHVDIVTYLVENKCKLNLFDSANRSPLMKAVQCQQEKCVAILLEHGADPNLTDSDGNTALHFAVLSPKASITEMLLDHNANIDAQNKEGYTPLSCAVSEHHEEIAELLLKKGADVHARDQSERTPLMIAASGGDLNLVKILLKYGADISHKDTSGWTAEDHAALNGYSSLRQHLAEYADLEDTGEASAGELSTPHRAGATGSMWGAPAMDRGGRILNRGGAHKRAIDDISQGDSIRSSEKPEGDDLLSWPSEEEEFDFSPKKPQNPNLVALLKASQLFRKSNDGEGSRIGSSNSSKKSFKQGSPSELLNQGNSRAGNLEVEDSEEEEEDDENFNGDEEEDYETEEEEEEDEEEDDEEEEEEEEEKKDENLTQHKKKEEDLEAEETESNDILEEEQGEKTEPKDEIQKLEHFSNTKYEGEKLCGTGDVCDDKIRKELAEKGEESVGTPVSFIAGCNEKSQENTTAMSPKIMNNEASCKSVPKQSVFQKVNNFQGTQMSLNGKSMIQEKFHRNDDSCFADSENTDWKKEIPHPTSGSCGFKEKKSSFSDGFKSNNNSWSAAKNTRLESERHNPNSVDLECMTDEKVSEAVKTESGNMPLNTHEENLRTVHESSNKVPCQQQEEEDSESPWDSEEESPEQEKEKEKVAKEDTVEDLGTAVAEGVKNAVCNDGHQVCSPAKGNAGALSTAGAEEEDSESPWDSEEESPEQEKEKEKVAKEDTVEDLGTAVAEGVKNAVCNDGHPVCSPAKGNAGKYSESAISDEKEDVKDAIENYGDKYILETNILIENPAHENQTDKTEIAHREGLAENEESHSADKQLSPKPWEERYERMWVENEKRELKTNFKNITAELKQLFGEINETQKTTSLVEAMSENDCSEELKSSHVSSHVTESSNKLKSKGGCGDIKLRLGGKVPKMEIVIPSLSVLHDQNNLNDNMENTWSPDQNDTTKVPLAKRKEKKMHPMKIEGNENGSSRNVERSPEDSPRHSLKTSILDDVSNALAKIRPVPSCDENELLVTETKPGKGSEFYDYVPSDCLINSKKIGEVEIGSLFANAQPSCGMLKRNLDEELKQDMERFKSKVGMLQTVFLALEKENEQLQKEVEKEKSRPKYFQTQEVAKQEDLDKSNMMPGNITNQQMKQKLTLKKNDCLKMENENSVEEKDKNNFSSERPKLIEMPVKGKFALNAKASKKNRRHTSKQKASQQMSSSSENYFPTLDDSTFSETSKDEKRPAAKTESEKNKVSVQMDVTDELDLTHSSDTTSEDVESPTSTYKEAMLLLEQLNLDQTGSTVLLKIQDILLEYEQMIEHEKNLNKAVCRELRKLKSKKESSQLIAEETQDLKSKLAHQEAEWKSDIQSLKCTLKQEEEKRLKVETLYEKTREKLTRKEDQYCKEMEEKQQLELQLRNLEMELIRLKKLLKQVEEERDEAQRQLSQEKNARVLQEGILKNQFWRQKEQNSEESAEREKDLLYKNQLLKDDIAKLRLEIDQLRRKFLEEEGKYLEENETLKEKNEDLKKELKQKEEALTQTAFQYHGQLNLLKTESAVLTSKLEQTKESKERLETEMASFSSRLNSTVQELERHQSSKDEAERAFNREREEWLRLQEKLLHDLSVVRETNKSCSQQLSTAESKANGLENELHQLKQTLREKTLLLEMTQKELSQAQCQAKECDRAQQLEKDRVSKYIIKQESMQERLAQLQSENLLFRQQLEDMQNKGIMKEKAVNDVHDWFNDIFNKLRADTEKQVSLVEERNKELNVKCAELREQVFKYETNSAEREGMVRQLQQELADALKKQSMSEASLEVTTRYRSDLEEDKLCLQKELEKVQTKVYNRLEDLITGLQTAQAAAEDQQQQQGESERKLAELKHPFELSLEQEMKRNTELQKECMRLKRLLSKAMKKLRLHEENECELNVQGGMKKRYSEMANEVDRLRTKVGELTQQLDIESKKCIQLEIQNQDLQEELSTMRGSHEKLKKSKCQLKEEVATLKHRLETSVVDRSQMEQYKREVEEQAAQEIRQKLQEVNIFLQTQAASQDRIEQIRDSHHASLRNQLKQRITELECELDRIKYAQQDSIFQKESTWAEVERYKVLYQEELKMRRCLENKLERANAKLLRERDRSQSLITSSIVNGGLATSPLVYSTDLGHLASSLALNRSLSIGGSYINTAGNALTSRSSVEAFVTKVRQELDETISKVVEQATTELETGSARASSEGPVTGSSNISTLTSIPFPEQYRNTMMF